MKSKFFENEEFGKVRTIIKDGEPWFVGKDVATILDYSNGNRDIIRHVDDEDRIMLDSKTQYRFGIELGQRGGWIINESGLYALILGSEKLDAKKFKHWVTSEVLPTIRRTGSYSIQQKQDSYMIENPAERARRWAEEYEEKLALEQKIEQDKPLVEYASQIQTSDDTISMAEMAKIAAKNGIKIGRTRLFEFLRKKKVLDYKNVPYQRYVEQQPWFEIRESTYYAYGEPKIQLTTRVTPKGQIGIVNLLKRQEAS